MTSACLGLPVHSCQLFTFATAFGFVVRCHRTRKQKAVANVICYPVVPLVSVIFWHQQDAVKAPVLVPEKQQVAVVYMHGCPAAGWRMRLFESICMHGNLAAAE